MEKAQSALRACSSTRPIPRGIVYKMTEDVLTGASPSSDGAVIDGVLSRLSAFGDDDASEDDLNEIATEDEEEAQTDEE